MKFWLSSVLLFVLAVYIDAHLVNIQDCGGIRRFNCESTRYCPVQFDLERCNNPKICSVRRGAKYNINVRFQWGNEGSGVFKVDRILTGVLGSMFGKMEIDYETRNACISAGAKRRCRREVMLNPGTWYTAVDKFNIPQLGSYGMKFGAKYQLVTKGPNGARITLLCALMRVKLE
ncbi:uncharacterized protein LOC111085177 [Limulus polyphemus]|uniref:Uncharacterized protein LOC111085177 n=1 Tax=Limulus polyphemus TaxID=6850 RepID=A0ABM1S3Y0_LIMPO|nr:uncharacterized protein LOC111085177 [Limulus polyphemus]XP_022238336.1 uncharacterized protein LOC111085177 [Limulus polyphemus]